MWSILEIPRSFRKKVKYGSSVFRVCIRGAVSWRDVAIPRRSRFPAWPSREALKSPPTRTVWPLALALTIHFVRMFVRMEYGREAPFLGVALPKARSDVHSVHGPAVAGLGGRYAPIMVSRSSMSGLPV